MQTVTSERAQEVETLIRSVCAWARGRPEVRAVALVGSWARGSARMDSDVDLIVLTDDTAAFIENEQWARELGARAVVRTRQWGVVTERRLVLPGGLEVEVGVVAPGWACIAPLDEGTARVVSAGFTALHDPEALLAALLSAVR